MFKSFDYNDVSEEQIKNLSYAYPKIFWVELNKIKIKINNIETLLTPNDILILPADQKLDFSSAERIESRNMKQIIFSIPPDEKMISLSRRESLEHSEFKARKFTYPLSTELKQGLMLLYSLNPTKISRNVRLLWCNAFYLQLAESGLLHILFPDSYEDVVDKLYRIFSSNPSYKHNINDTCKTIGLSKATLIRRLNQKNTKFKLLLRKARINHAISIINSGEWGNIDEIAYDCGYHSTYRFQTYFKEQTGMTPREYVNSMLNKALNSEMDNAM